MNLIKEAADYLEALKQEAELQRKMFLKSMFYNNRKTYGFKPEPEKKKLKEECNRAES